MNSNEVTVGTRVIVHAHRAQSRQDMHATIVGIIQRNPTRPVYTATWARGGRSTALYRDEFTVA